MADLGKLEEGEPNIKMMTILENIRNNAQCTNENGQNGMKLRAKNKTLDETERSGVVVEDGGSFRIKIFEIKINFVSINTFIYGNIKKILLSYLFCLIIF